MTPEEVAILEQLERLDHTYDHMSKVWAEIQANLRNPWKQNDRRAPSDKGGR